MNGEMQRPASGPPQIDVLYRFGCFQLDPAERTLTRGSEPISLTPKAFDTLCVLVENSGRLVTKDQLLDRVWPETYVEEKTLAQNIFTLRKALGTDAEGRNYIETVPKRGYRFSVNVFKFPRSSEGVIGREQRTEFIIEEQIDSEAPDKFDSPKSVNGAATPAFVIDTQPMGLRKKARTMWDRKTVLLSTLVAATLVGVFLFYKYGARKFWTRTPSFTKVRITKLTNTGDVGPMSLSRDGKYVVYVQLGPGRQSLVVRQTGSTSLLELVPPDRIGYLGVSFSPDGNTIYYVTRPHDSKISSVYRIPLLGGTPIKVIDDVDTPVAVSPDGKQIAFIRNVPPKNERQLIIAGANGGEERVAATSGELTFGLYEPSWSPDQESIALSTIRLGEGPTAFGIGVVNIQTGSVQPLGKDKWRWVGQIAWLAGGNELVAAAATASDPALSDQLWVLSYPSGEARRVTNDINGHFGIGVSHEQSTIASVISSRNASLWMMDANDLEHGHQLMRNSGDRMSRVLGLSISHDDRLLYASLTSGAAEIWTMQSDGTQNRQLTFDGVSNTMPVATPDGKYILYLAQRGSERFIARMQSDGSNPKTLAKAPTNSFSVTPDSKWIVFASFAGQTPTLMKLPIDGGESAPFSKVPALFPAVSHDGKLVACYVVTPDRKRRLSTLSFDTGEIVKQFDVYLEYDLASIRWTPDGKALAFVLSTNGVSNIWVQRISGGSPQQFTKWDSDVIFRFDWSRHGKLAVERGMFTNDIILIHAEE